MITQGKEENCSPLSQKIMGEICFVPIGEHLSHLEWNFEQPSPYLIGTILQSCLRGRNGNPIPSAEILDWSINRRLQGLLAITVASRGNQLSLNVKCAHENCGEMLDLDLDLNAFSGFDGDSFITVSPEPGTDVVLRPPTGRDQTLWLKRAEGESPPSAVEMAADLVVKINGKKPKEISVEKWLPVIEEAFEKQDPFTHSKLNAVCPQCGKNFSAGFSLEETLLQLIRQKWSQLLDEVHHLAMHYHWNEKDILAVPPGRRRYYLDRIHEMGWS